MVAEHLRRVRFVSYMTSMRCIMSRLLCLSSRWSHCRFYDAVHFVIVSQRHTHSVC